MLFPCGPRRCVVGSVVRNAPQTLPVFRRQGRGAFFMSLTACIVPLRTGLSKSFLRRPWLRNWVHKSKIENRRVRQKCSFPTSVPANRVLMINLLVRTGSPLYNGLCPLFSVLGFSLNLRNRRNLITRLYMCPLRTGHAFLPHVNTSISHFKIRLSSAYFWGFAAGFS